jgi:hypothetical protein
VASAASTTTNPSVVRLAASAAKELSAPESAEAGAEAGAGAGVGRGGRCITSTFTSASASVVVAAVAVGAVGLGSADITGLEVVVNKENSDWKDLRKKRQTKRAGQR